MHLRASSIVTAAMLFSHAAMSDCEFSAARDAEVDAAGIRKVVVEAGAGDLKIRGSQGAAKIHANGEACADSQARLDAARIDIRREGDTVFLRTVLGEEDSKFRSASMDLTVHVPSAVQMEVHDSSGDVDIGLIAALNLDDSSGDQVIRDIHGNVEVTDSSGEIEIKNIRGNVIVSDSSGDVSITDVTGNVSIPVDSSGGLSFRRVHGELHIASDSSGDISIADVNQDVIIDNDSAGDIRVVGVGGDLRVANDSTGDIEHRNVLGEVSLPQSKRNRD
ncbi:MAG TPA: DUF4097 family beta strand repeat-containing protein [Steroidobacteraceae bacterium]|nr:DUF4097 family beta strand repeat-containing protein [Steroidobacteraceae bacterium]